MKNDLMYLLLALITGALIPVQAATNAAFSKSIGSPLITGLVVFLVGLLGMLVFILLSKIGFPTWQQFAAAPLYSYFGGVIVAAYVVMITLLVPKLGVGASIGLIVTGQITCAVVIDHFGLFDVPAHSVNLPRATGVILMIIGIYLVMKKQ